MAMRRIWVVAHRWAGLTLALFLAVAGFTGIFLAWIEELEIATAPELHLAEPPAPGMQMMSALDMRAAALERYPEASIDFAMMQPEEGHAFRLHLEWLDPATGLEREDTPAWDDLFINPYTGEELGRRQWGDIAQGMKNLMPFLYRLHYSLALDEEAMWIFGLAALVWTLDCFIGFYLTLPTRAPVAPITGQAKGQVKAQVGQKRWWSRWRKSWRVRWGASRYKLNFDLHRAGGLWIWPLLLVFAWSSVSFNLPQVYVPVMQQFGADDLRVLAAQRMRASPHTDPEISFEDAAAMAPGLARQAAWTEGLDLLDQGEPWLWYSAWDGMYYYGFTTDADIGHHGGGTMLVFDGDTGKKLWLDVPTGANAANTFTSWITMLHTAHVFGNWWRVAVSLIGAMVTMLSITGVVIWLKKRSGRAGRRLKRETQTMSPTMQAG